MIEILGYIFVVILTVGALLIAVELVRGIVEGCDLAKWKLEKFTREHIRSFPGYKKEIRKIYYDCIVERLTTTGISYERNGKTWDGYGTGR